MNKVDVVCMFVYIEVEVVEMIIRERVFVVLKDYSFRLVILYYVCDYGFKDGFICDVVDVVVKREINGVMFVGVNVNVFKFVSIRKVFFVFVE